MDFDIEIGFVKKHIKKNYQDRLIFELQSKKHREKALSRFSHFPESILNDSFKSCDVSEIEKLLCEKSNTREKSYIISADEHDGESLFLSDAFNCCMNSNMMMILISEKFVLVKEECEKKPKFLLSRENLV